MTYQTCLVTHSFQGEITISMLVRSIYVQLIYILQPGTHACVGPLPCTHSQELERELGALEDEALGAGAAVSGAAVGAAEQAQDEMPADEVNVANENK